VIVEILGIRDTNNPDKWWGPDGKCFNSPLYFINKIPDTNENERNIQIAWQIKWPEKKAGGQTFFNPEGAKGTYSGNISDRYGNMDLVMISTYDYTLQKINLKTYTNQYEIISYYVTFKNVSLIPNQNHGFEIEVQEAEKK
jgi:hypothetical protein